MSKNAIITIIVIILIIVGVLWFMNQEDPADVNEENGVVETDNNGEAGFTTEGGDEFGFEDDVDAEVETEAGMDAEADTEVVE